MSLLIEKCGTVVRSCLAAAGIYGQVNATHLRVYECHNVNDHAEYLAMESSGCQFLSRLKSRKSCLVMHSRKSAARKDVRVRLPPSAPFLISRFQTFAICVSFRRAHCIRVL